MRQGREPRFENPKFSQQKQSGQHPHPYIPMSVMPQSTGRCHEPVAIHRVLQSVSEGAEQRCSLLKAVPHM